MAEVASSADSKQCVVCVEDIDGVKRLHVTGPCNHVGVCRYGQQLALSLISSLPRSSILCVIIKLTQLRTTILMDSIGPLDGM